MKRTRDVRNGSSSISKIKYLHLGEEINLVN